jgi:molybdopterin synthase sulfur carrier subunit
MRVRVLFFGATAALVGTREVEATIDESDSPTNVLKRFAATHPALRSHRFLFAVNEEYVADNSLLKEGDELAIFTAVSGG